MKVAKTLKNKKSLNYRRLKLFDVIKIGDQENLIELLTHRDGKNNILYYVKNEELYDILYETHTNVGHGGKHRMISEIKLKCKHITQELILLYLKFCEPCQT